MKDYQCKVCGEWVTGKNQLDKHICGSTKTLDKFTDRKGEDSE